LRTLALNILVIILVAAPLLALEMFRSPFDWIEANRD
jgi:hypothetical protein